MQACSNCSKEQQPHRLAVTAQGKPICRSWRACAKRNGVRVAGKWDFLGKPTGWDKGSVDMFNRAALRRKAELTGQDEKIAEHKKGAHSILFPWVGCPLCVAYAEEKANREAHQIYTSIIADRSYL